MAITPQTRQSQLFAAEDWQTIYGAFTQINFASYDFNTIRSSMIDYIRLNYPEDFNDWIESSELVAIIDLLAYLGTSLAFRMDLNTRENFLDTAQRRESVFRLARMLSYQPQLSIPAQGLLKITQVTSNQAIYDSNGLNLQNSTILWNDPNNANWYEQFILVLNSSLNSINQFGDPVKKGTVNGIPTEIYQINIVSNPIGVLPFSSSVAGNNMSFELINPDFVNANSSTVSVGSSGYFYELAPNPLNSWNLIYRNDGLGYSSANTGFFFAFKQGTLGYTDYSLSLALANRVLDVDANGVNQTDVFVQSIDSTGLVVKDWTRVPSVNGFNVIYNSLDKNVRDVYSVISRDSNGADQVSIRFADGNFGNVPTGLIRVWYRVSNGLGYQIRPDDMNGLKFSMNYTDQLNNTFSIAFSAGLTATVNNSQSSETINEIKSNSSQVYYTQDRMVNGEDYNLYPLQSSQALKVKAVNRTYSGHNRYIDITDPTGSLQNITVFGDDGILYNELDLNQMEASVNSTTNGVIIVNNYIQPLVNGSGNQQAAAFELRDFYYSYFPSYLATTLTWKNVTTSSKSCTGAFMVGGVSGAAAVLGTYTGNPVQAVLAAGALVEFDQNTFAAVASVVGDGTGLNRTGVLSTGVGSVTLDRVIPNNTACTAVYAPWRTTFTQDEITAMANAIAENKTFGIGYDSLTGQWYVINNNNLATGDTFSLTNSRDKTGNGMDASWLLKVVYNTTSWSISARSLRYVFESVKSTRFYFANTDKVVNLNTGQAQYDYIKVLSVNAKPDVVTPSQRPPLGTDYYWRIKDQETYPDGYVNPNSVRVTFWDSIYSGIPDNPYQYTTIVDTNTKSANKLLFWQQLVTTDGYQYYQPTVIAQNRRYATNAQVPSSSDLAWTQNEFAYVISTGIVYQWANGKLADVTSSFKVRTGRDGLIYQWQHYAPTDQRINPASSNIVDIYVLTNSYDTTVRNWIYTNGSANTMPVPPTSEQLRSTFSYFESYKMISDTIVWHPVKYKMLFGTQADPTLQVVFKVVKVPGITTSDNEIKSMVINAINVYFELSNWDFGQSFYFTELAAYIHLSLATMISSVVITPVNPQAKFGDLFEIRCNPDEIFISTARVSDVQLVTALNEYNLGITHG
jgi:hypothetical protein